MTSSSKEMKIVPTKKYDGGYSKAKEDIIDSSGEKHIDAFAYFSSRDIRMDMLLGRHGSSRTVPRNPVTTNPHDPTSIETQTISLTSRKTRISFELDPTIIMLTMLNAIDNDEGLNDLGD